VAGAYLTRPRFVLWTALVRQLPLQLFLTLWAGMFFGGMLSFFKLMVAIRPGQPVTADILSALFSGPALMGTLFFLGVPAVTAGSKFLNYRNTRYALGDDYIDVEEGFWTAQRKRVLIEDLREVTVRRGVLQRMSGVGSVYLASRVQGGGWSWRGSPMLGATSMVGSGVMLMDLPDWAEVADRMQRRLEQRRDYSLSSR
jgi:membrane protein YdbS with pleckstrin-like domain